MFIFCKVCLELFDEEFFFMGDLILWSNFEGIFIFWVLLKVRLRSEDEDWFCNFLLIGLIVLLFVVELVLVIGGFMVEIGLVVFCICCLCGGV